MEQPIHTQTATLLLEQSSKNQSVRFFRMPFSVPTQVATLTLEIEYTTKEQAQIPIILFDALGNIRIMRAAEGNIGKQHITYTVDQTNGSHGVIPGPITPGIWKLVLYKRRYSEDITFTVTITAKFGKQENKIPLSSHLNTVVLDERPGWYCGELHTHSLNSTGRTSVEEIQQAAKRHHLDFISLTDHFTASHWQEINGLFDGTRPLFLQSMEISGDYGHANAHGLSEWINPLIDDNEELSAFLELEKKPTMESLADETHRQGGLFSINHALSGLVSWRYHDFPMEKADLFEIWCLPDGPTSFLYPTLWDGYLTNGYHLTGVGSSDSHHPTLKGPWEFGQIRTWVYAQNLSREGILQGLKSGNVYVAMGDAKLNFTIKDSHGNVTPMGSTLTLDSAESYTCTIELRNIPSGNLFIFTDAQIDDVVYFPASQEAVKTYSFPVTDKMVRNSKTGASYFRVEFHEDLVKALFFGMAYRDHHTMRLLSNPIWITRSGS